MRLRFRRIAAAGVATGLACAAAIGCFDFDATMAGGALDASPSSYDGAEPPVTDDATLPDGYVPGDDGGPPVKDGAPPNETGPVPSDDAGFDAGLDANTYCAQLATPAVLCEDFDLYPLPGLYFNVHSAVWGTLTKTKVTSVSAPDSLDLATMPLSDGGVIDVALRDNQIGVPTLPKTLTFSFSLNPRQIDAQTAGAATVLGAVDFIDSANNRYSLGLAINVAGGLPALALDEQSGFADGGANNVAHVVQAQFAPNMNQWNTIAVTIVWSSLTSSMASVTVNGQQALAPFATTMTVSATSLQVGIGTSYVTQPAPVWEMLYDNVVFTEQ